MGEWRTSWLRRVGELHLGRLLTGRGDEARHEVISDLRGLPSDRVEGSEVASPPRLKPRDIFIPDLPIDSIATWSTATTAPAVRVGNLRKASTHKSSTVHSVRRPVSGRP